MAGGVDFNHGRDRLDASTRVLQRARLADSTAGLWEAADIQWWWRRPRATDEIPLPVWFDDLGPCAAVAVTDWGDRWQGDALLVPDSIDLVVVWSALLEAVDQAGAPSLEVLARDDALELLALLAASGFNPTDERGGTTWMDATNRPAVSVVPDGFRIVDRASQLGSPHPMRARNGDDVETRLRECSLYDPGLDLAVETLDGEPAGYALFWLDPATRVGMLEPMRVEDAYQRRGLARALLTAGLDRLAHRGARRLKVNFASDAGRSLYVGAGFSVTSTDRSFRR